MNFMKNRSRFLDWNKNLFEAESRRKCVESLQWLKTELAVAALWEDIDIPGDREYRLTRLRLLCGCAVLLGRVPDYQRILRSNEEYSGILSGIRSDRLRLEYLVRELETVFLRASGEVSIRGISSRSGLIRRLAMRIRDFFRGVFA